MVSAQSIDQFDILNRLGEGAFGTVYKIKRKEDGIIYAMKKVKMQKLSSKEKEQALNEIRILASLNSPYIIKYKDSFFEQSTSELCIIMEFADKGDLQGLIAKTKKENSQVDEEQVWKYAAQILQGLKYLHDLNILHRDLKGANIFLSDNGNSIKLGDLNVSKVAKKSFAHTQTGTPYYLSPEVWRGEPYNSKCDIWSLGCVIYELTCLVPPFTATSLEELYKKVLKGQYNKLPAKYSADLNKFIQFCLIISPKTRASIQELLSNPRIQPYLKQETREEKIELLKTMKLPYGGLNQIKNILPKAKYDYNNNNNNEEQKQNESSNQPRGVRSNSSNPERPQSARGNNFSNQSPKNFQQQPQQFSKQQGPGTPKITSSKDNQPNQNNLNYNNNNRLQSAQNQQQQLSKRHGSQDKLMQNYNNNQYYNKYYNQPKVEQSSKPQIPTGQVNQSKPPINPQKAAGIASNFNTPQQQFGRKNMF